MVGAVKLDKLFSDGLSAIWRVVINDNKFPVKVILLEGFGEQVGNDGQVLALVVSGQYDGVSVFGHFRVDISMCVCD